MSKVRVSTDAEDLKQTLNMLRLNKGEAMTQKQIQLRLPIEVMEKVKAIAKIAGVTPTQVYNVMLATHLVVNTPRKP